MAGIVATVKLSGLAVLGADGRPLRDERGDLIVRHEKESTLVPFTLGNGDVDPSEDNFLIWLASMPSTGVTFRMRGFKSSLSTAQLPDPLRLDWSLYAGGTCLTDSEPVWEGSTWWTLKSKREGMLVQVAGLSTSSWLLKCAVEETGGATLNLEGTFEYFCPSPPQSAHFEVVSGDFVG